MAERICSDCGEIKRHKGHGRCGACYQRWRKANPDAEKIQGSPFPENFYNLMDPQPNGCIWLTSKPGTRGYAYIWRGSNNVGAHVVAWELTNGGPVPDGLAVDHLCHSWDETCAGGVTCLHRRCVNPGHLDIKTIGDNVLASPHTLPAINAAKTRCIRDHPLSDDNLYIDPTTGSRNCRECRRERKRSARRRHNGGAA